MAIGSLYDAENNYKNAADIRKKISNNDIVPKDSKISYDSMKKLYEQETIGYLKYYSSAFFLRSQYDDSVGPLIVESLISYCNGFTSFDICEKTANIWMIYDSIKGATDLVDEAKRMKKFVDDDRSAYRTEARKWYDVFVAQKPVLSELVQSTSQSQTSSTTTETKQKPSTTEKQTKSTQFDFSISTDKKSATIKAGKPTSTNINIKFSGTPKDISLSCGCIGAVKMTRSVPAVIALSRQNWLLRSSKVMRTLPSATLLALIKALKESKTTWLDQLSVRSITKA